MLVEDHFIISVSKRVNQSANPGPYHQHHMSIELHRASAATRSEAMEKYEEVRRHYPEPIYRCTLMQVVCRAVPLAESSRA